MNVAPLLRQLRRSVRIYRREAQTLRQHYPESYSTAKLIRAFPAWYRALHAQTVLLDDERPWLTFSAIRFLGQILMPDMRVYEFGTGGSTLFFAQRVAWGVSIEHDPVWASRVDRKLKERGYTNWQVRLIEPTNVPSDQDTNTDPDLYRSLSPSYRENYFEHYVMSIDRYPDKYFDVILIDGRARSACFRHAIPKVNTGGYIVWDNTDRLHYASAMKSAPLEFEFIDFPGPAPCVASFTRTSAWRST